MVENKKNNTELDEKHLQRREFLRKSIYAAYATPVIMSLLVEKANASGSFPGGGRGGRGDYVPPPPE